MNETACETIELLLVEYLDGDLGGSESQRVADHIAQCPECQANADLLERSLAIAKRQWEEAVSDSPEVAHRAIERRGRKRLTVAVCAACAAVVMVGAVIVAASQSGRLVHRSEFHAEIREGQVPGSATAPSKDSHEPEVARNQSPRPADESPGHADIDAMILREVQSARLAASARLLASQPGLEEFSDRAASYLSSAYGDHQSSAKPKPVVSENGS